MIALLAFQWVQTFQWFHLFRNEINKRCARV